MLLVEGPDDKHVVGHLLKARGLDVDPKIPDCTGIDGLLKILSVQIKESEITALAIVVDADTDLRKRWVAIQDRLTEAGYAAVPSEPAPEGTIVDPPENSLLPRVGIWLMPDNRTDGILEDFLRLLVPEGSALFAHVEASVDAIPTVEHRFTDAKRPKALIHTWLAWQEEPGLRMGTAIKAKYLDPSSSRADLFIAWLQRLFGP